MKVVFKKHFPFGKFIGINMFARLYLKDTDKRVRPLMIRYPNRYFRLIQHERSHTKQQNDLWGIGFYIWYVIEWFFKLFTEGKAYRELGFEREARANETYSDIYDVYVYGAYDCEPVLIYDGIKNKLIAQSAINDILNNIEELEYIDFRPINFKGSLINHKWGSWLKYIFKRKP